MLVASLFFSACDEDTTGPVQRIGAVAQVQLNGTRPEFYLQDLAGADRQRIHFTGAVDPFPQNSPLVPAFRDENLLALGHVRWSPNGQKIAMVGAVAFDQSEVVIVDANGANARVASPNTQIILSDVEWSADGNQIAYAMSTLPHALGVELFITDLQQNQVRKVTTAAGWTAYSAELRFTADASQLFYARTTGEAVGFVPNYLSQLRSINLASGQVQVVRDGMVGEVNAIARDGSWVLLLRHMSLRGNGRYDRQLIRRNLTTGQETVLVANGDIQYARLLPGDQQALVVIDVSTVANVNDYRYSTIELNGGSLRSVPGTGPTTTNVAVHPTVTK
jgi:hypothetical protein